MCCPCNHRWVWVFRENVAWFCSLDIRNSIVSILNKLLWRHHTDFAPELQGLSLSIWFTCPSGTWFWKFTCHANIFMCPANICISPVKLMYTAGKISTCPDWKITCPVGHVTTKFYVPWVKIYMPRACGHALVSSPELEAPISHYHGCAMKCLFWVFAKSHLDMTLYSPLCSSDVCLSHRPP